MNTEELFNLTATYLSVLRVEHVIMVKLIMEVAGGRINCSRLIRVLGSHIEKENDVLTKHGLTLSSIKQLRSLYEECYEACTGGKLTNRELSSLLTTIKSHDDELRSLMDELVNRYFSEVANEILTEA
ncbi:MAG: hypothetical protein RXR11_04355 [Caldivirga sp.]|jgi:hypothetical protein